MLIRFFYFPTPTYTGCDTDLGTVKFDDCNPKILLSEIRRIFVAKANAAPFTDWTQAAEWLDRLSDVSVSGDDYIRTLVVRGNKPAPASVVKELSNMRRAVLTKTHTINAIVDEAWDENHEFMRQNEAGGQVRIWYEIHGGYILGGNEGLRGDLQMDMVLNEGAEEIVTYNMVFTYKSKITEERAISPIFDIGNTGEATTYDSTLTFAADTDDTEDGITATIDAANATVKFEFNGISPQVGTPQSMTLVLGGIEVMVVDYTTDYTGAGFRYTDAGGNTHTGIFTNGIVNF